ncbi:TlpA family protein disulfide reductase [Carboxylicivirga sp. RSCT41]|uniref:TlpA family protein disulfide reductase n=1 Tax=Carboxylicivirga agarovorans TaxID=3417570 RepID=UPI003D34A900
MRHLKRSAGFVIMLLAANLVFAQNGTTPNLSYDFEQKRLECLLALNKDSVVQTIAPNSEKYLLLDFSFVGCRGCMKELPKLDDLGQELKDKLDIVIVWNAADYNFWKSYVINNYSRSGYINLCDSEGTISSALKLEVAPSYLLFDKEGQLLKQWKGRLPGSIKKYME